MIIQIFQLWPMMRRNIRVCLYELVPYFVSKLLLLKDFSDLPTLADSEHEGMFQ
jgi:hypothetical protein